MIASERRAARMVEVFPRDGLQTVIHEPGLRIPTSDEKVAIIQALDRAGIPEIEVTGFAHPKVIPSLADAEDVARRVLASPHQAVYRALVPNLRGAERAFGVGLTKVASLLVVSETYQRLNSNMSLEENLREIERIVALADRYHAAVTASMGMCFVCPYEGVVPLDRLLGVINRLVGLGISEFTISDSVGLAWPQGVRTRVQAILTQWPHLNVGLHLHTLAGTAVVNAFVGYEAGAQYFESSVGGIGGGIAMPVHTTTMANVATEDLVYMFEMSGIPTGVDLAALAEVGRAAQAAIGTGTGHVTAFGTLEAFLTTNRRQLGALQERPPGSSAAVTSD